MGFLSRLVGAPAHAPAAATGALAASSARFAEWLSGRLGRTVPAGIAGWGALDEFVDAAPASPAPEALLEDAAVWLGEGVRMVFGGAWGEDAILGPVVRGVGGVEGFVFRPHDAARKKWALRGGLSLSGFAGRLPSRIEGERALAPSRLPATPAIADLCATDAGDAAAQCARALSSDWERRFGAGLPANLRGVRELDRWLRTHYIVSSVTEPELICAGFHVGEVARGLFGGAWVASPDPVSAALRFPELDYKPVGRVFRMFTELPEGEPLEDYVRVLPAARRELRG